MPGNHCGNKMINIAIKLVIKMTVMGLLTQCLSLIHGHSVLVNINDKKYMYRVIKKKMEKNLYHFDIFI